MGGLITVRSKPGVGSTFSFTVMLRPAPPEIAAAEPARRWSDAQPQRRLRVLIVEDNGTNRLVASRMVERMGHHVDAVADGSEAVQEVRAIPYDLILMDVMMPGMDGLTATRLIRAEPGRVARTPIVGLTASAERGREVACRAAGMDGFVTKPVTAPRLAAAIEAVMAGHEPATPPVDELPMFDADVLRSLAWDIGEAGMEEVVDLFLCESPRMVEQLEHASVVQGRTLLREVHTLASATRNVGLLRTGQLAADIESALAMHEPVPERLNELLLLLRTSIEALESWIVERRMAASAASSLPASS